MADLLPCPFCGSGAQIRQCQDEESDNYGGYYVACTNCHAGVGLMFSCGEDARPLIAEKWNRRASLAPPEPLPEDVAYLGKRIVDLVRESVRKDVADGVGRIVQTFCQRAVEAAVAEIQRRITREMDHADLHGMEDAALVDNIHGAVWNYADEIRARGAAQEQR